MTKSQQIAKAVTILREKQIEKITPAVNNFNCSCAIFSDFLLTHFVYLFPQKGRVVGCDLHCKVSRCAAH